MDVYITEQEQIALLKKWLKTYAPPVILGIIIALGIGLGWRYWRNANIQTTQTASVTYVNMIGATLDHLDAEAALMANSLIKNYSKTPYAQFASLLLAKQAAENGAYDEAANRLNWVINTTHNAAIKHIATIRLAKINIAEGNPQAALTLLDTLNDTAYTGIIDGVRGDAYLALKQPEQAKAAYAAAEQALPPTASALIQMKLANLP